MCTRIAALTDKLREYQAANPDVLMYRLMFPKVPTDNLSESEKFINEHKISAGTITQNLEYRWTLYNYLETPQDIIAVLTPPKSYFDINGVRRFEDTRTKHVNTVGGNRRTVGQPKQFDRSVFLVGGCGVFGFAARDEGTIASRLQALFNEQFPNERVIVHNYGYYLAQEDTTTFEELKIMNALPVKPGDIVICGFDTRDVFPLIDLSKIFQRPHNYGEPFFEISHLGEDGFRGIAQEMFPILTDAITAKNPIKTEYETSELTAYKQMLRENFAFRFGAVVVNCNPFTLGHRHLIEQAAQQCDRLAVFVVQEDKSEFSFDDRFSLVKAGTADLPNVFVIPSGRFILSSLTFEEYFNKSELQERAIDSSIDVTLFAKEIAPTLNICVRFAGEEPLDAVTRQYNETMAAILPQYGIEFVEIPRLEVAGVPVSASNVRKLLADGDWDALEQIVPATTLEYLRNK
jgi:[citrate (pro-3S)-lyase] ligase